MSNHFIYKNKVIVHPGYYIQEIIDEWGISQKDFAMRLNTTPKNLSVLIRGEQGLSTEMAVKLSRMLGTSAEMWINLQKSYEMAIAEVEAEKELNREKRLFRYFEYAYYRDKLGLSDVPDQGEIIEEGVQRLREHLKIASLDVLTKPELSIDLNKEAEDMSEENLVRTNASIQIAVNEVISTTAPDYDRKKFARAMDYVVPVMSQKKECLEMISKVFWESGVVLVLPPIFPDSDIETATKKIGRHVLFMLNSNHLTTDQILQALQRESARIIKGEFGATLLK